MNILATQYTLQHKSLEIYLAGCNANPHCTSCFNSESWNFNQGIKYDNYYFNKHIKQKCDDFSLLINNIFVLGGEPNDQDKDELLHLLFDLKSLNKKIWIFTRYDLKQLPKFELELCDYIKCGKYIPELTIENNTQYGIKLATSNQKIYKKNIDY